MKISECEKYVRYEIEDKQIMVFKVILLNEYKIILEYDILVDQIDCIGRIYRRGGPRVFSKLNIKATALRIITILPFNAELE